MPVTINNIADSAFEGLKVEKIFKSETCETLMIRLEANHVFPKHTTPKEALLIIHQGEVVFKTNDEEFTLNSGDTYVIPVGEEHTVTANADSILLIIR